jgi:UDP-N-acetylglucosamine 2-epimerase (non-hydrolysing)
VPGSREVIAVSKMSSTSPELPQSPRRLPRVHVLVGTRPEAVKMAPLATALRASGLVEPVVVATGQHTTMVSQALAAFGQVPDITLELDRRTGEQAELVAELAPALDRVLAADGSAAVVVQGDTTSVLVGGLVAFWRKVPLVHLEAGLRSGDLAAPFPEEANRRLIGVVADLHLAPTRRAADALLREHVPDDRVVLVGNTVVDAVLTVAAIGAPPQDPRLLEVLGRASAGAGRVMLVTAHRRENWGGPLDRILAAVEQILDEHPDLRCVLPAHGNPAVRAQVDRALGSDPRVVVTDPLPYAELCGLLSASSIVLSDSGGIQEEAPSFRVPVLVLRDLTERMEAVEAGWAQLVGSDPARIVAAAKELLDGTRVLPRGGNPFGDGVAATRSAAAIGWLLGLCPRPAELAAGPQA